MNKKAKAALILTVIFCILVGGILFVLLEPGRLSDEIVRYLNDAVLEDNGWVLSIGSLDGQIASDLRVNDLYLKKHDGSVAIFGENCVVNLDFSQMLTGDWAISELSFQNGLITIRAPDSQGTRDLGFVEDLARHGFGVRELNIGQTSLIVQEGQQEILYSFDLAGKISSAGESLRLFPENLRLTDLRRKSEISITGGEIELSPTTLVANAVNGSIDQIPLSVNANATLLPDVELSMELDSRGVDPSDYLGSDFVSLINAEKIDSRLQLTTDMNKANVECWLYDSDSHVVLAEGKLSLEKDGKDIQLNRGELTIGSSQVKGKGFVLEDGSLSLDAHLDKLDLQEFGLTPNPTNVAGRVQVTGNLRENRIGELVTHVSLQNDEPGSRRFVRAKGRLLYEGDAQKIELPDSIVLDFGYGKLLAHGRVDLNKERVNLSLTPENVDLQALGYVFGVDSLGGKASGALQVSGLLKNPSVDGYLRIENGEYDQFAVSTASLTFTVHSITSDRDGFLRVVASNAQLLDYAIESGQIDISFQGDTILVASTRLEGGDDFLQLSGRVIGDHSFHIDQAQLVFQDNYVASMGPVELHRGEDYTVLDSALFRVNDGTAEFSFSYRDDRIEAGSLRLINLDLASLWSVLHREVIPITGAAFADVTLATEGNRMQLQGRAEVKDGLWGDMKFDNLLLTCGLENNQLSVKEFRLDGSEDVSLEVSGFFGTTRGEGSKFIQLDSESDLDFSSDFRNFDLSLLAHRLPEGWRLGGAATGSLVMSGLASSPEMVFQFTIDEPKLDKIRGKTVSGSGRYTDQRVYFEDLVGYSLTGHYRGEGYAPVDLAPVPEEKDRFLEHDPISMKFQAKTSSLDFLTPYFSNVDSITGDIELEISIEGTPVDPIRNGYIKVGNGRIYALHLDLPVDQVDGSAILKDNKFIVDELVAASHIPSGADWAGRLKSNLSRFAEGILFGAKDEETPHNLHVTGSMDMDEFFRPNLAFLVSGKDVYMRTLLGEIEGMADINLSVTGKDTINIVGDIIPREAVLRREFTGEGDYGEIPPEGGTVTRYELHFPIDGNLFVRNSQIDAELAGEISIYKLGNNPYRYSGELDVLGGKFYYYSDIFHDLQGHLTFDPTEFNPMMDVRATTEISGTNIEVSLTGDFKEPIVRLEASDQFFSQSDLLELLTFQKQIDEESMSVAELGSQPVYLLGKFLETEIERGLGRSLARATPLDEFEIERSSSLLDDREMGDRAVKVGSRVSSDLYLSYKQSFSLTESQVAVEYRIDRNLSVVVTYDEDGEMHLTFRQRYKF